MKRFLRLFRCVTVAGDDGTPYIHRYYLLKTKWLSVYVHNIVHDDDLDMHDHPWNFMCIMLKGGYVEHMQLPGFRFPSSFSRRPGDVIFHGAGDIHRIQLYPGTTAWSLVIMGPKVREWGFHTKSGWVLFKNYVKKKFVKGCE